MATYVPMLAGKLNQQATWWPRTGNDGFGGDTFGSPSLVDCRWQEVQEVYRSQIDQQEHVSKAIVFVDTDMSLGDYLCLGDQTGTSSPVTVAGASKIQFWSKTIDLRAADNARKAVL